MSPGGGGSLNVEEFFQRLLELAQQLNEEEKRGISEGLSEEELALFDILTKPEMKLTEKDRKLVKKTARELLETLKREKLVLDWRKRQASRADVKVSIKKILDGGLPEIYDKALYQQKSQTVFQHIYESYFGAEAGIYVT
jgi:type I restriction enzyme R subunit